jgi:hypothetical protein
LLLVGVVLESSYVFSPPFTSNPSCHRKKERKRKKKGKCKTKKEPHKKNKSEVWLSDFTKAETGPIWLVRFVRIYQACELIRFYQG